MATTENQPSLVIIGSWNPAILNPDWLARKIFDKPENVEMPVIMEFATKPGMPPRYTIEGIIFVPAMDRLMIYPQIFDDTNLQLVEEKSIKLLSILSHTPVLAFGQNFEFLENEPSEELLNDFNAINGNITDHVDDQKELITSQIVTSHVIDNGILHFTRIFSKGSMSLKFNFHYDVVSAPDAVEKMNGTVVNNLNMIKQILENYDTEINDNIEVTHE